MNEYNSDQLQQLLAHSQTLLVVLPQNPSLDHLAAGLSLHLSAIKSKKKVQIFSPTPITVEHNRLIGVDQVINQLTGHNLIISLPDQTDNIERVYTEINQQSGHFEIVIEPRKGGSAPNHQTITYAYQGSKSDVIFFLDTKHPEDFSHFEEDYFQSLIDSTHLVRISTQSNPDHPKTYEVLDQQASSISEIIFKLLQGLQMEIDSDVATNILAGIEQRTVNLTNPDLQAATFEIVAQCLRMGAVRGYVQASQTQPAPEQVPEMQVTTQSQYESLTLNQPQMSISEDTDDQIESIAKTESTPVSKSKPRVPEWLVPKIITKAN